MSTYSILKRVAALLLLATCVVHGAWSQSLVPRAYLITPTGTNAFVMSYSRLDGGLALDGAVPITGATAEAGLSVLSFYHSLDLLGRSANFTLGVPYADGTFQGPSRDRDRRSARGHRIRICAFR